MTMTAKSWKIRSMDRFKFKAMGILRSPGLLGILMFALLIVTSMAGKKKKIKPTKLDTYNEVSLQDISGKKQTKINYNIEVWGEKKITFTNGETIESEQQVLGKGWNEMAVEYDEYKKKNKHKIEHNCKKTEVCDEIYFKYENKYRFYIRKIKYRKNSPNPIALKICKLGKSIWKASNRYLTLNEVGWDFLQFCIDNQDKMRKTMNIEEEHKTEIINLLALRKQMDDKKEEDFWRSENLEKNKQVFAENQMVAAHRTTELNRDRERMRDEGKKKDEDFVKGVLKIVDEEKLNYYEEEVKAPERRLCKLGEDTLFDEAARNANTLKVLQMNLLAHGLASPSSGFAFEYKTDADNEPLVADFVPAEFLKNQKLLDYVMGEFSIGKEHINKETGEAPDGYTNRDYSKKYDMPHRLNRCLGMILEQAPDVITLQELDHFPEFEKQLKKFGFAGQNFLKPPNSPAVPYNGGNGADGVAIFWNTKVFKLLEDPQEIYLDKVVLWGNNELLNIELANNITVNKDWTKESGEKRGKTKYSELKDKILNQDDARTYGMDEKKGKNPHLAHLAYEDELIKKGIITKKNNWVIKKQGAKQRVFRVLLQNIETGDETAVVTGHFKSGTDLKDQHDQYLHIKILLHKLKENGDDKRKIIFACDFNKNVNSPQFKDFWKKQENDFNFESAYRLKDIRDGEMLEVPSKNTKCAVGCPEKTIQDAVGKHARVIKKGGFAKFPQETELKISMVTCTKYTSGDKKGELVAEKKVFSRDSKVISTTTNVKAENLVGSTVLITGNHKIHSEKFGKITGLHSEGGFMVDLEIGGKKIPTRVGNDHCIMTEATVVPIFKKFQSEVQSPLEAMRENVPNPETQISFEHLEMLYLKKVTDVALDQKGNVTKVTLEDGKTYDADEVRNKTRFSCVKVRRGGEQKKKVKRTEETIDFLFHKGYVTKAIWELPIVATIDTMTRGECYPGLNMPSDHVPVATVVESTLSDDNKVIIKKIFNALSVINRKDNVRYMDFTQLWTLGYLPLDIGKGFVDGSLKEQFELKLQDFLSFVEKDFEFFKVLKKTVIWEQMADEAKLEKIFKKIDTDNSGKIDKEELTDAFKKMQLGETTAVFYAKKLIKEMDSHKFKEGKKQKTKAENLGSISLEDLTKYGESFLKFMKKYETGLRNFLYRPSEKELKNIFQK